MKTGSPSRPLLLLLGAQGQLGRELARALDGLGDLRALGKADLDVTDEVGTRNALRALAPAVIVNAAAYTRVDDAETEPAQAFAVNEAGPRILAEEADRARALLVHYSTDFVFDGTAGRPYRETDPPNPLGVYGASKLAGEEAVKAVGGSHLILRTSWLYGSDGGFVSLVRRQARRQRHLRFVDDEAGSPTWSRRVAEATRTVLERLAADDRFAVEENAIGVYHVAALGGATRFEFAKAILDLDPDRAEHVVESVERIPAARFGSPARRPACSILDSGRIEAGFGVRIGPWRVDLKEALLAEGAK